MLILLNVLIACSFTLKGWGKIPHLRMTGGTGLTMRGFTPTGRTGRADDPPNGLLIERQDGRIGFANLSEYQQWQ